MKWLKKSPSEGDIIRIRVGDFFHYGIYISDGEVIAFGFPPQRFLNTDFSKIKVVSTSLEIFKNSEEIEVFELNSKELKNRNSIEQVKSIARSKIGHGNYDPIKNNCEHFVYECVFNNAFSEQINEVKRQVSALKFLKVYIAKIPFNCTNDIYPESRGDLIRSISNENVRNEKFYVWKLLEFALKDEFNLDIKKLDIVKNENGKWISDKVNFSLSHSGDLVCVAVSKHNVGVDIELIGKEKINDNKFSKILTASEIDSVKNYEDFLALWSMKEAIFKYENLKSFVPNKIDTTLVDNCVSKRVKVDDQIYILSVHGDDVSKVKFDLSNELFLI